MADQTDGTITIDATPAEVMAVICDFESYPDWASGVKSVEILEADAQGRGAKVRYEVSMMGISGWYVLTYDYASGDGGVSWSFVEGSPLRNLEGTYGLAAQGDGTFVTYTAAVDPGIPMIGFMKRKMEKAVIDTALKGLKNRVESLG